jgi:CubicO group peptidase (beta-lactamase class C family)
MAIHPRDVTPEDVRDRAILYERYGRDWTGDKPHLLWSASKSFATTLVGISVHQGRLELTDSICDHIEVGDPASCAIRVQDLMDFSSGLAWRETYENDPPTASSVLAMLFGQGSRDMSRFVTGHPLRDPPGSTYQYSSGDTNVLTDVARAALEEVHGERYPWTTLFEPLGIASAVWERDGSGLPIGSSYLYLTPRDMARYGAFMLDDGCWQDERLLPAGWWARAARGNDAMTQKAYERAEGDVPGWGLWLNHPVPAFDEESPWPAAPTDVYCAMGHWRQAICAIPSHDLVVARVADDRDGTFSYDDFLPLAVALADAVPVPAEEAAEPVEEPAVAEPTDEEPASDEPADESTEPVESSEETAEPEATEAPTFTTLDGEARAAPNDPQAAFPPDKYDLGLLKLATSFAAKEMCSCVFVSGRDEEVCKAYIKVSPAVARVKVDQEEKTVRSRALGMAKTEARWLGEEIGCAVVVK